MEEKIDENMKIDLYQEFRRMKKWLIEDGRFPIGVVDRIKLVID